MVDHHVPVFATIVFGIVMALHGAIHLLGFVKGFDLAEVEALTIPISPAIGAVWLAAAVLFVVAVGMYGFGISSWWMVAAAAAVVSQVLALLHWGDAWAATIPNVAVLLVCAVGYGNWQFDRMVRAELEAFRGDQTESAAPVDADRVARMPEPVERWLNYTQIVGQNQPGEVWLRQTGRMRTDPEGGWMEVDAEQYVRLHRPGYLWLASVQAAPLIHLAGRDKLVDGRGEMLIELLSLFPVADASGPEIDQGSLVRYLAEIVWYPSAALEGYVTWKQVDANRAEATIEVGDLSATALFEVDDEGRVVSIEADRYYDRPEGATMERWIIDVPADSYAAFDGVRVPTRASVSWMLDEKYTWYELQIAALERREARSAQ